MNDKLISSDEGNFDKMNVEFISGFKENKCPIDLKKIKNMLNWVSEWEAEKKVLKNVLKTM